MLQLTKHGRAQGCCVVLCLCGPNVRPNVFSVDYQSVLGVLGTRGDGLMRMEAKAQHFDRSRRCICRGLFCRYHWPGWPSTRDDLGWMWCG